MATMSLEATKERLRIRKENAATRNAEIMKSWIANEEFPFRSTDADAKQLKEMGEDVEPGTEDMDFGRRVDVVYLKSGEKNPRFKYGKYAVPATDFHKYWGQIGAELEVNDLFEKKPAPAAKGKGKGK
jgi:hypothetical protein